MKLLVGLGNPGSEYKQNRHNAGYLLVDHFAEIYNLQFTIYKKFNSEIAKNSKLILAKPTTFMNNSGVAAKKIILHYKLSILNLFVVHDDLDLPLGEYKIQFGVGPKLHGGINSIEQVLGTTDFWRIRIGVDNRNINNRVPGEAYVLEDFSEEELQKLKSVFPKIMEELLNLPNE